MEIINYTTHHLEDVKALFFENVPKYFAAVEWEELASYLKEYQDTYFLARINGTIIGCGGYHFSDRKTARLSWDFVKPSHQGQGIGSRIVIHCLEVIKHIQHIESIEVWTSQLAYPFYENFGFVTNEIRKDHWAEGFDLYRMNLKTALLLL